MSTKKSKAQLVRNLREKDVTIQTLQQDIRMLTNQPKAQIEQLQSDLAKAQAERDEAVMREKNALITLDQIYEVTTGSARNGLSYGIIENCRTVRNSRDAFKQELDKAREEIRQEKDRGWALSSRLQQRLYTLTELRHDWSKYLAAQAVGASAETVEELRVTAFAGMVRLLELDVQEPLLQSGEMGMACAQGNYRPQANLAKVANRYTEL